MAFKLSAMNSTVICIDVQTPEQEIVSKQIVDSGKSAFYYACDITSREQVDRTIESIDKDVGCITMLYHCCSLPSPRSVVNINEAPSVKQTFDLSVTSYFYVSKRFMTFFCVFSLHSCKKISRLSANDPVQFFVCLGTKKIKSHGAFQR